MEISAAVINAHGHFEIGSVELGAPQADEVLVRVIATGICHTDIAVLDGDIPWTLPAVIGHEGAGIVEAVGADVTEVVPGDHVVMSFASCGICGRCANGDIAYCEAFAALNFSGRRADGSHTHSQRGEPIRASFFHQSSFATHALASRRNVVKVPNDLPLPILAPLGCGVQTGAGAVFNRLRPERGSSMVVFGMGAVGLSSVLAAAALGCSPIVAVDLFEDRLALAREFGATHILHGKDPALQERLAAISNGGFAFAVEATGVPGVMAAAAAALRKTGAVALLGVPGVKEITFGANIMRGVTIHTCVEGDSDPRQMIPRLIDLYRSGAFPYDRMIRIFPFAEINEAVARTKDGSVIKPVLLIEETEK